MYSFSPSNENTKETIAGKVIYYTANVNRMVMRVLNTVVTLLQQSVQKLFAKSESASAIYTFKHSHYIGHYTVGVKHSLVIKNNYNNLAKVYLKVV